MPVVLYLPFIILLGFVVYRDFKELSISIFTLLVLFVSFLLLSFIENGLKQESLFFSINLLFTAIELLFILIYLKLRKKINFFSEINSFFGWGDVLFLIVACLAFSPLNYIFFTLTGTVVCCLFLVISSLLSKKKISEIEIPFAGILAAWLILLLMGKIFIRNFSFYNDFFLLSMLYE